jgi:LysM repeat protein
MGVRITQSPEICKDRLPKGLDKRYGIIFRSGRRLSETITYDFRKNNYITKSMPNLWNSPERERHSLFGMRTGNHRDRHPKKRNGFLRPGAADANPFLEPAPGNAPQTVVDFTATPTPTPTATITPTFTATSTSTPVPTSTPLPPKEYTVKASDSCVGIAFLFNVSVQSIVLANDLPADCGVLSIGQKLLIPQPTATATPQATSTPDAAKATESDCQLFNYNVPQQAIKDYNGLPSDIVMLGQTLHIPLCKRLPTPGPTSTPTPPPPYPAANLLLPADGASFISANDVITLQWSSVATLRQNESYAVTIEDLTAGTGDKVIDYVSETKYIVPTNLRPSGNTPHIFRWTVVPVRQSGSTKDGQPIYEQAGAVSSPRVFSWLGSGAAPTSQP